MPNILVRVIDTYVFNQTEKGIKFLILKRSPHKLYGNLWQGIAGKIERGETAWEAAIRELKEETGLTPIRMFVADHISKFYESHKDRINLVPVFGVEVYKEKVLLSEEHSEFRWVDYETAFETLIWNGQKEGLKAVFNMLNSNDDRLKWSNILINN